MYTSWHQVKFLLRVPGNKPVSDSDSNNSIRYMLLYIWYYKQTTLKLMSFSTVYCWAGGRNAERAETSGPANICRGLQGPKEEGHGWQVSPFDFFKNCRIAFTSYKMMPRLNVCFSSTGFHCFLQCTWSALRAKRWKSSSPVCRTIQNTCDGSAQLQ